MFGTKMEPKWHPERDVLDHPVLEASWERKNKEYIDFWSPGTLLFEGVFASWSAFFSQRGRVDEL